MTIVLGLAAVLLILGLIGWLGLHIRPAHFLAFPQTPGTADTMPLPEGLPAPVERFYRQVYTDSVPLIESAVASGWAALRPVMSFPAFPACFRFTHIAGQDHRHYLEITMFGLRLGLVPNPQALGAQAALESGGEGDLVA